MAIVAPQEYASPQFFRRWQRGKTKNYGFGGLGLTGRQRTEARQAARAGNLNEFFGTLPEGTAQAYLERTKEVSKRGRRASQIAHLGGFDPEAITYAPVPESPTLDIDPNKPGVFAPGAPASGPVPTSEAQRMMEDLLARTGGMAAPGVQSAQQQVSQALGQYLTGPAAPSFDELFGTWRQNAEESVNRQAAQLREQFGSYGARLGSDVALQEAGLRRAGAQDINRQGAQFALDLANLRTAGLGALTSPLTSLAGLETQTRENALQRLFLDSLRLTAPPPLFAGSINYGAGLQPQDVIAQV